MSQSIARNDNTATQDDENISINLILAILSTGIMAFIGILTETLTNVLFPGLMAEFHVDTSTVQWLTTGYLLTVALVTPLSSYFKRKLKLRTIFLTAIVLCITGCLMAACTLNFPMLMTARILQGAGTGIALPLMFNIILEQSPKSKIGMLMGVGGMVVAVAPALGPTVGGLVGTFMPWRWIFVILLPFLFVSLVCGPKTIHQVTPTEEAHINPLHVLCLAVGFVRFVFALDRGGSAVTAVSNGDTSATTQCVIAVVLLLIAMAALLVFAWVSHRAFSPLVRLTVLRSVKFRWHLLAYVLLQFVTIGYGYMIPNASQLGFGASVLAAGVVLLPGALLGAASAPVSGSLLDKFGSVRPMFTAMLADLRAFASKR
ncbi:MFS transporter [Bifidobacterium pseudocatenulatum]|uniref:MFS transporter n=1 Tax=Bifidobacterium pseudocatenulatum TaxID=28026 RepID=UPI00189B66F6|nr:MFS transporter [Bifidobacterium pseudocatenulatum]MDB6519193.1 MFS transporter [Bifidobacterium pseudocatenulatum]MDB6522538.1 MFS transporter [Bifidobacterium pseudocatenulatum]MDB6524307.1 MFS transporter [Bifidobacterium pseudocatenulatum]MDB6526219.1 MFS transporter [Bifidobacterium pseudocatenulatum]MDB6527943.1 MFS transporter [Bifidobacterium pseudocatenulatum]